MVGVIIMRGKKHKRISPISVVLHGGEVLGVSQALFNFVAVLEMLAQGGHPRVEDVLQAVPAHVLLRRDPEELGELILRSQPQSPQVGDAAHVLLVDLETAEELLLVVVEALEQSLSVLFVAGDEVEDGLAEDFGDVFALADPGLNEVEEFFVFGDVLVLSVERPLLFGCRNLAFWLLVSELLGVLFIQMRAVFILTRRRGEISI